MSPPVITPDIHQTAENDGVNNIESGVERVMAMSNGTLPQVSQGGELRMTLHQVNSDGAGPYVCMIDATGTGQNWVAMQVTQQVPGDEGDNDDGEMTDFVCAFPFLCPSWARRFRWPSLRVITSY